MGPYANDGINQIYELLFCDDVERYRHTSTSANANVSPWNVLFDSNADVEDLKEVLHHTDLETRVQLLAARRLAKEGAPEAAGRLMGVVIEVGLPEGLDVLAAYEDGTARYINYSGKLIVWDSPAVESNGLIRELFDAGNAVVSNIGPWEGARRPAPAKGTIRLNFLCVDGLYFGEGPFEVLQADAMGGPVVAAAIKLMSYLIQATEK
jgi:hypothetical protein